jgi:hypothetical protein
MDIVGAFMQRFGLPEGGFVHTGQGGELAQSSSFWDMLL